MGKIFTSLESRMVNETRIAMPASHWKRSTLTSCGLYQSGLWLKRP